MADLFDDLFDEFKEFVKKEAPLYFDKDVEVYVQDIYKNNTSYTGFVVRSEKNELVPTFPLERYYDPEKSMQSCLSNLVKEYKNALDNCMDLQNDITNFAIGNKLTDYDFIKDKIDCKIVSIKDNEKYLEDAVYTQIADLALVYYIRASDYTNAISLAKITKDMANMTGVSAEVLFNLAQANMKEMHPIKLCTLWEMMMSIMQDSMGYSNDEIAQMGIDDSEITQLVLTSQNGMNGAVLVTNKDCMDAVSERMGTTDIYIFPSSIHEVIIAKADSMSIDEAEEMIREVNLTEVDPDERLSDRLYKYDFNRHELYPASEEMDRNKRLEAETNRNMARVAGR